MIFENVNTTNKSDAKCKKYIYEFMFGSNCSGMDGGYDESGVSSNDS